MTPDDTGGATIRCYDCEATLSHRTARRHEVPMDMPDGGYEFVSVPLCRGCELKRYGHACDHCGRLHESVDGAARCCVGVTKAPDCPECGRRMKIGARGWSPTGGHDITWATCVCCPIGWGPFTSFVFTDDGDCQHVDGEPGKVTSCYGDTNGQ